MVESTINYYCYPRTATPPKFADELIRCFRNREDQIATVDQENGLKSDNVLETVRPDLIEIGFDVEAGKKNKTKYIDQYCLVKMVRLNYDMKLMRITKSGNVG